MDEVNIAWAAGYFEGEGCIRKRKCGGYELSLIQCCDEKIPDDLQKFADAIGGKVTGPYRASTVPSHWRSHFSVRLYGQNAVNAMEKLYPYLAGPKRMKWDEIRPVSA